MANNLSQIKHIVYLMLENRSLDNVLGWLYENDKPNQIITKSGDTDPYHGLKENTYFNQYSGDSEKHFVQKGTKMMDSPENDPHESFIYVTNQLFNKGTDYVPGENETPKMKGFLNDFTTADKWVLETPVPGDKIGRGPEALQMMDTYTIEECPVLNGLAKNFAVSDKWFSSVPTQTNCNRAFSICGNSLGYTDNDKGKKFETPTLWNILNDNGHTSQFDFMIFHQTNDLFSSYSYTRNTFPNAPEQHFAPYSAFLNALKNNMLPKYSYLEPSWYKGPFGNGNSYHPPGEVGPGEIFVKELYDKLINSECWDDMLFIITFDEHGGTYDHYPPPNCMTPPGPLPNTANPHQHNFDFKRYGVRVPTILISPWVESGTVFRSTANVPYDHTSFIATILNWFGVTDKSKWDSLGDRVKVAPTFDNVVNRTSPRTDKPTVHTGPISDNLRQAHQLPVSDLQKLMLPDVIRHTSPKEISHDEASKIAADISSSSHTLSNLHTALHQIRSAHPFPNSHNQSLTVNGNQYVLRGTVVNSKSNHAIYAAEVQAWDKDRIGKDDALGSSLTNAKGEFLITFDASRFGSIFIDRKPDIYFKVFVDNELVLDTSNEVIKNADNSETPILLQI